MKFQAFKCLLEKEKMSDGECGRDTMTKGEGEGERERDGNGWSESGMAGAEGNTAVCSHQPTTPALTPHQPRLIEKS